MYNIYIYITLYIHIYIYRWCTYRGGKKSPNDISISGPQRPPRDRSAARPTRRSARCRSASPPRARPVRRLTAGVPGEVVDPRKSMGENLGKILGKCENPGKITEESQLLEDETWGVEGFEQYGAFHRVP